jgi:hypothetical protein
MKILVRFPGDNDFSRVMRAFGTLLLQTREPERLTQEQVARLFNSIATDLSELVQWNRSQEGYLKIQPRDVYIGSEAVDTKMVDYHQWGNGDSVLLDFSHHSTQPLTIL